jgi:hypothetical protein
MTFAKALEALKAGHKVKLPHWKGYWVKENDTVKMYCKNGDILDIRETEDVFYTLSNIASDEWEVVEATNVDLDVKTFRFGEAIRLIKQGEKVARKGWNGKNQYIQLATNISYRTASREVINAEHNDIGNKAIAFVGTSGVQLGWLASQADMLAEDWITVD